MTDHHTNNLLAHELARRGGIPDVPPDEFANVHALLIGVGAIGRPLSLRLAALGVRRLTLVDPKKYSSRSIDSQCGPREVGRLKAAVVADLVRDSRVTVDVHATDVFSLPDGIVGPDTMILVSADNRRADIGVNRMGMRMRARGLLKTNVEPKCRTAAVRAYCPRDDATRCIECQFSRAAYLRQRHPRSCDAGGGEQSTASPRSLTGAAAELASIALGQLLLGGAAARPWLGHEWQFAAERGQLRISELPPNEGCGWTHSHHWTLPQRCRQTRETLTLQQLAQASGFDAHFERLTVRFCRQVVLRATCVAAGHPVPLIRWTTDLGLPLGACPTCGSALRASPFFAFESLPAQRLSSVWHRPLAAWGVGRHAVIQLQDLHRRQAFVVDAADSSTGETHR